MTKTPAMITTAIALAAAFFATGLPTPAAAKTNLTCTVITKDVQSEVQILNHTGKDIASGTKVSWSFEHKDAQFALNGELKNGKATYVPDPNIGPAHGTCSAWY
jgi:hypothetical protein